MPADPHGGFPYPGRLLVGKATGAGEAKDPEPISCPASTLVHLSFMATR